ncbi:MAG TPA: TonB-dependent receptor [bacterium]|nr:TonB-dependent receptor [bacterium]
MRLKTEPLKGSVILFKHHFLKRILPSSLVIFIALSSISFCVSQESFDIGEIVIISDHRENESGQIDTPMTSTVINRSSFENKFTTIPELLSTTAGLEIRSSSGTGSFSSVSIRGSESQQVLILLDGVALNKAVGGAVDIGTIPVSNIQRIEIFRSNAPVKFNGSPIGGVINIITIEPGTKNNFEAQASFGSFNTGSQSINIQTHLKRHLLSIGVNRLSSDGDFSFQDDNGTPLNPSDDTWENRRNNDFESTNLNINVAHRISEDRNLRIALSASLKDQGMPGLGNNQSEAARLESNQRFLSVDFSDTGISLPEVISNYHYSRKYDESEFSDPLDEIYLGTQNNRNITRSDDFSASYEWFPSEAHDVTTILGYMSERYNPHDDFYVAQAGKNSRRSSFSFAAEDRISLMDDRLLLIPSYRMENTSNNFKEDDPFAAAASAPDKHFSKTHSSSYFGMRFKASESVTLKANKGRYFRIPGFYELFGDRGAVIGNTDLVQETGRNTDFGLIFNLNEVSCLNGFFELGYFRNVSDNTIVFIQKTQGTSQAMNIGRAIVRGLEGTLSLESGKWKLSSNYTYQNAKDDSAISYWRGNQLAGRHERELNLKMEYLSGRWNPYYSFSYSSGRFLDRANYYPVDAKNVHDTGISYDSGKATFTLEAKNLSDNRSTDILGYPLPGRAFYLTVNWSE